MEKELIEPEKEIDPEIEKIRKIIDKMFKEKEPQISEDGKYKYAFAQNLELSKDLIKEGPRVVGVIIKELVERVKAKTLPSIEEENPIYGSPTFHSIGVIERHFPEEAVGYSKELVEILLADPVVYNPDRSTRGRILNLLKKAGDPLIISKLEEYRKKVKKTNYYKKPTEKDPEKIREAKLKADRFSKKDQEEVDKVPKSCVKMTIFGLSRPFVY